MQRRVLPALGALAILAGAVLAQGGGQTSTIVVRVPPDAKVKIGSQETTQRGTERRFVTPELVSGYTYSYQIEVRYMQGGKEVTVSRTVDFAPGRLAVVDLRPAAPEAIKPPTKVVDVKKKTTEKKVEPVPEPKKPDPKVEKKPPEPKPEPKVEKKPEPKDVVEPGFVALFNGKDLSGWSTVPPKAEFMTVENGIIIVSGKPGGYFYTDKSYKNYVMRFDWRYKRPAGLEDENKFGGNSGLLVHIQEPHKVWPKSLEVQGMNRDHGSLIGIGVKVTNAKFDRTAMEKARHKVGEWNTTETTVNGDSVSVKLNGVAVTTGNFELPGGPFGFQSEGAELHFKNIRIKILSDSPAPKKVDVPEKKSEPVEPPKKPIDTKKPVDTKKPLETKNPVDTKKPVVEPKKTIDPVKNPAVEPKKAAGGFKDLFNGTNLNGWRTFLKDEDAEPEKTFIVKNGEIQVTGAPFGYFYTDKSFKNYVITYDWTYPKEQPEKTTMNSGCLVHIQRPHKIWPVSVEPQVRYKDHGKFFFPGFPDDKKPAQKFDEAAQKKALKESYEWNTTEVTCRGDGTITVRINGVPVNETKSDLTEGQIGFQSEGARIHFRNIKIKMLD